MTLRDVPEHSSFGMLKWREVNQAVKVSVPVLNVFQKGITHALVELMACVAGMVAGTATATLVALVGQDRTAEVVSRGLLMARSTAALAIKAIDLVCHLLRLVGALAAAG
jgi:hypothetical protein